MAKGEWVEGRIGQALGHCKDEGVQEVVVRRRRDVDLRKRDQECVLYVGDDQT